MIKSCRDPFNALPVDTSHLDTPCPTTRIDHDNVFAHPDAADPECMVQIVGAEWYVGRNPVTAEKRFIDEEAWVSHRLSSQPVLELLESASFGTRLVTELLGKLCEQLSLTFAQLLRYLHTEVHEEVTP